jgi:hypothetical protein
VQRSKRGFWLREFHRRGRTLPLCVNEGGSRTREVKLTGKAFNHRRSACDKKDDDEVCCGSTALRTSYRAENFMKPFPLC